MRKGFLFSALWVALCFGVIADRAYCKASGLLAANVAFEGGPLNGQHINVSPQIQWLSYGENGVVYNEYYYVAKFPNWTNILVYDGDLIGGSN